MLDLLSPLSYEKIKISQVGDSVLDVLENLANYPSPSKINSGRVGWGARSLQGALRVACFVFVIHAASLGGAVYNGMMLCGHIVKSVVSGPKDGRWDKVRDYGKAFFDDTTTFLLWGGGSLSIACCVLLPRITLISISACELRVLAIIINAVFLLIGSISYLPLLKAVAVGDPDLEFAKSFEINKHRVGLGLSFNLRKQGGLVNDEGGLLRSAAHSFKVRAVFEGEKRSWEYRGELITRSYSYQFHGDFDTLRSIVQDKQVEAIKMMEKANLLLVHFNVPPVEGASKLLVFQPRSAPWGSLSSPEVFVKSLRSLPKIEAGCLR